MEKKIPQLLPHKLVLLADIETQSFTHFTTLARLTDIYCSDSEDSVRLRLHNQPLTNPVLMVEGGGKNVTEYEPGEGPRDFQENTDKV